MNCSHTTFPVKIVVLHTSFPVNYRASALLALVFLFTPRSSVRDYLVFALAADTSLPVKSIGPSPTTVHLLSCVLILVVSTSSGSRSTLTTVRPLATTGVHVPSLISPSFRFYPPMYRGSLSFLSNFKTLHFHWKRGVPPFTTLSLLPCLFSNLNRRKIL